MELTGEKLYYKEITEMDTDLVLKWRNSDFVREHFIHREIITKEEHLQWLHDQVKTGKVIQFIMVEKQNNLSVGSVYLRDVDYKNKTAEYGIFIGEVAYRGKGYGTEAAKVMISYAFDQLRLCSLTLRVLKRNKQAIRSYEKAGFFVDTGREERIKINENEETILFMKIIERGEPNE